MDNQLLSDYYHKRGFTSDEANTAIQFVMVFEKHLESSQMTLENVDLETVRGYVRSLKPIELNALLALARYFYLINRQEIYIYFTSLLGGCGVLENIRSSLELSEGKSAADLIMEGFEMPPLGMEPSDLPKYTAQFMAQLEARLPETVVQRVLAGNNHGIPREAFDKERELYLASDSLDAYLEDYQKRQIQVLQEHCDQNKVWFEQTITQAVVDFAASNQEIMSAVRVGRTLFTTKIPYDPDRYLQETDPKMKRYYACHCPFAREAILNEAVSISDNWCYCSGGFAKFPYEVIFDRPLRVELMASVLRGDDVCRFAVHMD